MSRDVKWAPEESATIEKIEVSQAYGIDNMAGHHKGHVVISFHPGVNAREINNKIGLISGVARTQFFNGDNSGIIVSIDPEKDAFDIIKKIGKAMLGSRMITQTEIAELNKVLGLNNEAKKTSGKGGYARI